MKQKIQASITGTAGSVDAAALILKAKAAYFGLTPDWGTLEVDGVEDYGTYFDTRLRVMVSATCHGELEVPE